MTLYKAIRQITLNTRNVREFVQKFSLESEFDEMEGKSIDAWKSESYAEDKEIFVKFLRYLDESFVVIYSNELQKYIAMEIEVD